MIARATVLYADVVGRVAIRTELVGGDIRVFVGDLVACTLSPEAMALVGDLFLRSVDRALLLGARGVTRTTPEVAR